MYNAQYTTIHVDIHATTCKLLYCMCGHIVLPSVCREGKGRKERRARRERTRKKRGRKERKGKRAKKERLEYHACMHVYAHPVSKC